MSRSRDLANLANNATGLETLTVSDITDLTATATELNKLDGVTATTAELNYVDGVGSALQTQIDAKAPTASPTFTGNVTYPAISKASYTSSDATTNNHGTGSGVIRQVQTNQMRHLAEGDGQSFHGTGFAVCIDNVLQGSDLLVNASFSWYVDTGNVGFFTFYKRVDTGSGFNTEAQVSVDDANDGITGGLQHAGGQSNYNGTTDMVTIQWLESNVSAGRHQFEVFKRCDTANVDVGMNARGQGPSEVGSSTIWVMELT